MANRSMVFASKSIPVKGGEAPAVMGLSEYPYDVPFVFKLLASCAPVLCPSAIWTDADTPVAIAGDAKSGVARLKTIRAALAPSSPNAEDINAALEFLTQDYLADFPFILLEPGEVFDMSDEPLADSMAALLSEIKSLDMTAAQQRADTKGEISDWGGGEWTHILYFEPSGTIKPPISPLDTSLTTDTASLIASKHILSTCTVLTSITLSFDAAADLAEALKAMTALPALKRLRLNGRLETLPEEIGELTGLTRLAATDMGLKSLPDSFSKLSGLTKLFLQKNAFDAMPSAIAPLTSLKNFAIWNTKIGVLPDWIGDLKDLEVLNIARCELAHLPDGLWHLTGLTKLNIGGNSALRALSPSIANLAQLEELQAHSCALTALPASLASLKRLSVLNVSNNEIKSIPLSVRRMKLDTLRLKDNPMQRGIIPFGAKTVYL